MGFSSFAWRCVAQRRRRRVSSAGLALGLLILLLGPATVGTDAGLLSAQPDWLEHEFWIELEPVAQPTEEYPLDRREAAERVLEEARYVYSAMVFGMRFRYVPLDLARRIDEEFELSPVSELPWGDPAIRVRESRRAEGRLWARVRYTLREHELRRLNAWASSRVPVAAGRGEASLLGGWTAKREAIEDAMRLAIREHVRARVYNKPREIRGRLALYEPPRVFLRSGSYVAQVRVRLEIEAVEPYAVY